MVGCSASVMLNQLPITLQLLLSDISISSSALTCRRCWPCSVPLSRVPVASSRAAPARSTAAERGCSCLGTELQLQQARSRLPELFCCLSPCDRCGSGQRWAEQTQHHQTAGTAGSWLGTAQWWHCSHASCYACASQGFCFEALWCALLPCGCQEVFQFVLTSQSQGA